MADRIVLNPVSYHGKGAVENIVPKLRGHGCAKAFVATGPDLLKFGVTGNPRGTSVEEIAGLYRGLM